MRCLVAPWLVVACLTPPDLPAAEPPRRHEVVMPRDDGINVVGINTGGDVVGFEWRDDPEHAGVIGQEPFLARRGQAMIRLPLLPTYTSTFPAAVSDAGLVVGRASKPMNPRRRILLQNQAFVWTETTGIRGLGALPDDFASLAAGVTRDGATICGTTIGDNRVRACLWERKGDEAEPAWAGTALPQEHSVASHNVAISDDGRFVAGLDGGVPVLWSRADAAATTWTREAIGAISSLNPRAVNDSGAVAGIIFPRDGSTHAAIWTRARGIRPIPEPASYTRSEALAINNAGAVVGMIDGDAGSPVSPHAFVFEDDQLRILAEGGPNFTGATAINAAGQVSGNFEKEEVAEPGPAKPAP